MGPGLVVVRPGLLETGRGQPGRGPDFPGRCPGLFTPPEHAVWHLSDLARPRLYGFRAGRCRGGREVVPRSFAFKPGEPAPDYYFDWAGRAGNGGCPAGPAAPGR